MSGSQQNLSQYSIIVGCVTRSILYNYKIHYDEENQSKPENCVSIYYYYYVFFHRINTRALLVNTRSFFRTSRCECLKDVSETCFEITRLFPISAGEKTFNHNIKKLLYNIIGNRKN